MLQLIILGTTIGAVYGQSKIIGGENTQITQHPCQISLQNSQGTHFCGGFIISKDWIATAAHCVYQADSVTIRTYQIRAGSSQNNQGGQVVKLQRAVVHPSFSSISLDNDIALLRLASSITVNTARSALLPRQNQNIADGTVLNVTGWGTTENGAQSSPTSLKVVQVPTVNRKTCRRKYRRASYSVTDNMFCAGLLGRGGKDSCAGDSGGPAAKGETVYGIVSWGVNCADPNYPGIYTQLSRYINFIKRNTGV